MDLELTGKVAIITGGSDGIGKATALSLAGEGARVAICARSPEPLVKAADDIHRSTGAQVIPIPADVRDRSQVEAMVKRVVEELGRVDILVNNAGTSHAYGFLDADDDVWEEDLRLKVFGAIYFARAVIPCMKLAGGGAIVNVTTPGGKASPGGSLPTSASRAAGISITKALSKEFAAEGIRVNTVCVGNIKSGQQRRRWEGRVEANPDLTLEQHYSEVGESIPLRRIGEAREVGDVIAFLASDRASYITGSSVNVDGGVSPVV